MGTVQVPHGDTSEFLRFVRDAVVTAATPTSSAVDRD